MEPVINGKVILMECIFCKIVKGEIPCHKIYEDDKILAFLDIMPINKGHTLIVPKKHSRDMLEDDDADLAACIKTAKKLAKSIVNAMKADGFNLGINTKEAAGQAVFHTHFHIIPRFKEDGLKHWPGQKKEMEELKEVQNKILNEL